jgi:small ligand-binding sensory domain FIST
MTAPVTARIGSGLSTGGDPRVAAIEAGTDARQQLDGARAELVLVFCTGAHLAAPESTLEGVREALDPDVLIGCGAGGVLARGREIERGTAVAVWAAAFDGDEDRPPAVTPFHSSAREGGGAELDGLPDVSGASAVIMIPDPYSFPADRALEQIASQNPGVPVLGGISSARTLDGGAALFAGDAVAGDGAVGVVLRGVEVLPCVSQGAAPIGRELTVTAADGHVIRELDGLPALTALRCAIEELEEHERDAVGGGLLLGVGIGDLATDDAGAPDYLVRGIIGADPDAGTIAVGAAVLPGRKVRLHARDARSADRDLRAGLGLRREALGGRTAGALVFTCNGRGRAMFDVADHDADVVDEELGGVPAAGFLAAGEIGPVGGENFLHGFTATVAVFGG